MAAAPSAMAQRTSQRTLLAFDTSTARGGVAVLKNGKTLSEISWERQGSHAEFLTPAIEKCLSEASLKPQNLDALAIGHGPGSFTGVRVAVNAARSLGFALGKPTYVFDTSEILAAGVPTSSSLFLNCSDFHHLLTIVNAHKNSVYASFFRFEKDHWVRTVPLTAVSVEGLSSLVKGPHLCLGDGYLEYAGVLPANLKALLLRENSLSDFPLPTALGLLASMPTPISRPLVWNEVQALYIRDSGAEEKLRESTK
jgi:tRNA threonylcarbamoyladenosine biosynthesis protein TsaB